MRVDELYVVVSIGLRVNNYCLRMRRPKHLKQNEIAYRLQVIINEEEWQSRRG